MVDEIEHLLEQEQTATLVLLFPPRTAVLDDDDPLAKGIRPPAWWLGDEEAGRVTAAGVR